MPIKFPQLLQDSWNFMRNQTQFALFGIVLLVILQLVSFYLSPQIQFSEQQMQDPQALESAFSSLLPSMIISGIVSIFVNVLIVLNIKSINSGNYQHFFQNMGEVAKRLLPAIGLTILMVMPLSIAVSFGSLGLMSGGMAILAIPLMLACIFVFLKLCLVVYVYLIEEPQKTVGESLKFVWTLSRGRMRILLLFCILGYVLPSILTSLIGHLIGGEIGIIVSQAIGAALSLFMVIFSFRFYQAFRQLPAD